MLIEQSRVLIILYFKMSTKFVVIYFLLFFTSLVFTVSQLAFVILRLVYFSNPSVFGLLHLIVLLFNISFPSYYHYYKGSIGSILHNIIKIEPQWITLGLVILFSVIDGIGVLFSTSGLYQDSNKHTYQILLDLGFLNLLENAHLTKGIILLICQLIMIVLSVCCFILEIIAWRLNSGIQKKKNLIQSSISSGSSITAENFSIVDSSEDKIANQTSENILQIQNLTSSEEGINTSQDTQQIKLRNNDSFLLKQRSIGELRKAVILLCIMLTATVFPSGVALIFLISFLFCIILAIFSPLQRNTKLNNIISNVNDYFWFVACLIGGIYIWCTISALVVARLWFTSSIQNNIIWNLFGFGNWLSFKESWNIGLFSIMLVLTLFVMSQSCFTYLYSSKTTNLTTRNLDFIYLRWNKFLNFVFELIVSVSYFILLFWFATISIVVPCLMSYVWIIFLFLGIFLKPNKFRWIIPIVLTIGFVFLLSTYTFNLPMFMELIPNNVHKLLYKIGLRQDELKGIPTILYGILLLLATLFWRSIEFASSTKNINKSKSKKNISILNKSAKSSNYNSMDERGSKNNSPKEKIENQNNEYNLEKNDDSEDISHSSQIEEEIQLKSQSSQEYEEIKSESVQVMMNHSLFSLSKENFQDFISSLNLRAKQIIQFLVHIFKRYSFYLCLLFIYFVGLSFLKANILHAIYLVVFVLFFVFPALGEKIWFMLIIYTMFVISALYIYNTFFFDFSNDYAKILNTIGIYSFENSTLPSYREFFKELIFHYLILGFSVLTYFILKLSKIGNYKFRTLRDDEFSDGVKTVFSFGFIIFSKLAYIATIFILVLIILLHDDVTLFIFGFTLILFLCLAFSVQFKFLIPLGWGILIIYTSIILCLQYLYQFSYLNELADEFNNISDYNRWYLTTKSIGFRNYSVASLSLFPYSLLLILSIFQLKSSKQLSESMKRVLNSFEDPYSSGASPIFIFVMLQLKLFIQRLAILHHSKLFVILLFISSQLNPTLTGLIYLLAVMIVSPAPSLLSYIWIPIVLYSEILIISEFTYHLPYFEHLLKCSSSSKSFICNWIEWIGFSTTPNQMLGKIVSEIFVVLLSAHFQKQCIIWKKNLKKSGQHLPGKLFEDPKKRSTNNMPLYKKIFHQSYKLVTFMTNHFFDTFGYEISMFMLLTGSLITIQTLWGLIFFILFGILLFVGKRRLTKFIFIWIFVVMIVELITLIIFVFSMNPFPVYDFTKNLNHIIFQYIRLSSANLVGWSIRILICQYLILFFMAQQTISFWRNRSITQTETSKLLRIEQTKQKKMKVWISPPSDMVDFTLDQRNFSLYYFLKFLLYNNLTSIVLLIIFIYAAIEPSLIRFIQIMMVVVFLTFIDLIVWKTKRIWAWLGIIYYFILLTQTIFQIPLALYGNVDSWDISYFSKKVIEVIGFEDLSYFKNYFVDILIIALYYLQEILFDSRGYIFYTNYIYKKSKARIFKYAQNRAFRSGKLLKVYARELYDEYQRKSDLRVLKKYQVGAIDNSIINFKTLYDTYSQIYLKNIQSDENKLYRNPLKIAIKSVNSNTSYQSLILDRTDRVFMQKLLVESAQKYSEQLKSKSEVNNIEIQTDEDILENQNDLSIDTEVSDTPQINLDEDSFAFEVKKKKIKDSEPKAPLKEKIENFICLIIDTISNIINYVEKSLSSTIRVCPVDEHGLNKKIAIIEARNIRSQSLQASPLEYIENNDNDNDVIVEESITIDPSKDEELRTSSTNSQWVGDDNIEKKPSLLHSLNTFKDNLLKILRTIVLVYISFTDILCYFIMALNLLLNPSLFTLIFTLTSLGWAAAQYPYPTRYYWYFIMIYSVFLILLQYTFFIIQSLVVIEMSKYLYLGLLGWKSSTSLVTGIVLNVFLILTVLHHKNNQKDRGDWGGLGNSIKKLNKEEKIILLSQFLNKNPSENENNIESQISELDADAVNESTQEQSLSSDKKESTLSTFGKIKENAIFFISRIIKPTSKIGKDYYVIQTILQLILFVFTLLSFPLLSGRKRDSISEINSSNNISIFLVLILFFLFVVVCIDRVIYLSRSIRGKMILQFVLLIIIHILFFVIYYQLLKISNDVGIVVLQFLIFISFIYLLISSFQIQNGYPPYTYKEYLMRDGKIYYYSYTVYRIIPFLYEMKTLIDWTFTPTTLVYNSWMKLEDIKSTLFVRRFNIISIAKQNRKVGTAQGKISKFILGFCLFVGLALLLFFPLFFFSDVNPALTYNWVDQIDIDLTIPGWSSIYHKNFRILEPESKGITFTEEMSKNFSQARHFTDFEAGESIQVVKSTSYSDEYWPISAPSRNSLADVLKTGPDGVKNIELLMIYTFHRLGPPSQKSISSTRNFTLSNENREILRAMINGTGTTQKVTLPKFYNPFLLNRDSSIVVTSMDKYFYPNCTLELKSSSVELENVTQFFDLVCNQFDLENNNFTSGPMFVIQSSRIVGNQGALSLFSGIGILAFYTTFVLTVGRLLRMSFSGLVQKIPFEELDNVNILWTLVNDIYIARGSGDLELEERLYREIIRIFRVPSILHYWAKESKVQS